MPLVKYFKCTILLLLIFSSNVFSSVYERECGQYIYQVEVISGSDPNDTYYNLFYQKKGGKKILFYKASIPELLAACIQDKSKHDLMLFQEFCGGNGCPEDMYGIFDPNTKKILIKPSDWPKGNDKQVAAIIGYELPSLVFDKRAFCCEKIKY